MIKSDSTALLSQADGITIFSFRGRVLRFLTPPVLECFTAVKSWQALPHGSLLVMAKYRTRSAPVEEVLELKTSLIAMGDSPDQIREFLAPIQRVEIVQEPPCAAPSSEPGRLRLTFYGFETLRECPDCWQVRDAQPPFHAAVFARRWANPLVTDMNERELVAAKALLRKTLKEQLPCMD